MGGAWAKQAFCAEKIVILSHRATQTHPYRIEDIMNFPFGTSVVYRDRYYKTWVLVMRLTYATNLAHILYFCRYIYVDTRDKRTATCSESVNT